MSTSPHEVSTTEKSPANLLFDYPGADIILRSQDRYLFLVPKTSVVNNSPILDELIRNSLNFPGDANARELLPDVQLPERGEILHCLLTFIFPVIPLLPPTPEDIMELLFVAQKYQMKTALIHIRGSISRQKLILTCPEQALCIYSLAQKYGLRPEALQAARAILNYPTTIEVFDNKLDIMSGASLYEFWKYSERVQTILASDLTEFRMSSARGTVIGLRCSELSSFRIPRWLDRYIESVGKSPNLFDYAEFSIAMARHTEDTAHSRCCKCGSIPSQTIREFWEALASVVDGSFEKAETTLSLVGERESRDDPQPQTNLATSPLQHFNIPDANLIIRSSDSVDFRVHKSVLAIVSPFFEVLLSLPQPSDSESVDGIPVVELSEDSDVLNSLVSILYPVDLVIPTSYEKVLYLLAACQKYEMASVQSLIRAKIKRGEFPAPNGAEAFSAYMLAISKGLIPEIENAARQTLDHPMTFEALGEGLKLFEGCALRDLASFRIRVKDNLVRCLDSFLEADPPGPSSIWVGCITVLGRASTLPKWLSQLFLRIQNDVKIQNFTLPLDIHSRIRQEFTEALQNHLSCSFCMELHTRKGPSYCAELEDKLMQVRDKVRGDHGSPWFY